MRLGASLKTLLIFGLALRLQHDFHGPPIDYLGLGLAAAASWIGVPGPGEPILIAGGVFAAKHKLDIGEVLLVAWAGATAGGVAGWLIGGKMGRAVVTTRGPLQKMRIAAVARGDEVFARYPVLAILLTPSWIAGIHRVRTGIYLPTNAVGAALWAASIGLGAYFVGPPVIEFVDDLGLVTVVGVVLLVLVGILIEVRRRRRRGPRGDSPAERQRAS